MDGWEKVYTGVSASPRKLNERLLKRRWGKEGNKERRRRGRGEEREGKRRRRRRRRRSGREWRGNLGGVEEDKPGRFLGRVKRGSFRKKGVPYHTVWYIYTVQQFS